jgi:hypothetical protein
MLHAESAGMGEQNRIYMLSAMGGCAVLLLLPVLSGGAYGIALLLGLGAAVMVAVCVLADRRTETREERRSS